MARQKPRSLERGFFLPFLQLRFAEAMDSYMPAWLKNDWYLHSLCYVFVKKQVV